VTRAQRIFVLALAIGCAGIASLSFARETVLPGNAQTEPKGIRVADDYCNTRCEREFNYCRYRNQPAELCDRRLVICRSRC
jgi:hypothetical protein